MPLEPDLISTQSDWSVPGNFSDQIIQSLYKVAYSGHLAINFFLRPQTKGAYVAVWQDEKVLLIRNSYKPAYTLPCGGIEKGETPKDAARRELMEEVGLNLPIDVFLRIYETINYTEFKQDHITLYEVQLTDPLTPKPDGREVIWAGYRELEDALKMPLFPPVRDYLLQSTAFVGKK